MKKINKIIFSLCLSILLTGCMPTSSLEDKLKQVNSEKYPYINYETRYYSFYKQQNLGILKTNPTSMLIDDDGVRFVADLRVDAIINSSEIMENIYSKSPTIYKGIFVDNESQVRNYRIELWSFERYSFLYFRSDYMDFMSYLPTNSVDRIACDMLRIVKTLDIDTKKINEKLAIEPKITYQTDTLELFETLIPENGTMDEILTNISDAKQSNIGN